MHDLVAIGTVYFQVRVGVVLRVAVDVVDVLALLGTIATVLTGVVVSLQNPKTYLPPSIALHELVVLLGAPGKLV